MNQEKSWFDSSSTSPEHQKEFEAARLILWITELISEAIEGQGLSRAQVAKRMDRSAAFVTQLLAGDRNMTLRSVAELGYACGIRLNVTSEALAAAPFIEVPTNDAPARASPELALAGAGAVLAKAA